MMHPLPFPYRGTLTEQDGSPVAEEVPFAWWPASLRAQRSGAGATHEGEGRYEDFALWDVNGRKVTADGMTFTVISAERQSHLRHTTLLLKRVRSRG